MYVEKQESLKENESEGKVYNFIESASFPIFLFLLLMISNSSPIQNDMIMN